MSGIIDDWVNEHKHHSGRIDAVIVNKLSIDDLKQRIQKECDDFCKVDWMDQEREEVLRDLTLTILGDSDEKE